MRLDLGLGLEINKVQQGSGLNPFLSALKAANCVAFYDRTDPDGVVKDENGSESIYWDLMVGSSTYGDEQSSGAIITFAIYKITACQTNFFYTGCQVGDVFPCFVVKTCDINNKVKRVLGNHLVAASQNVYPNSQPLNGVFDGVNDFVRTAPFTLIQPEWIISTIKNITWTNGRYLYDGNSDNSGALFNYPSTPSISMRNNTIAGSNAGLAVNEFKVVRHYIAGANSFLQVDDNAKTTGNSGTNNMGGITIGCKGGITVFSNFEFRAMAILPQAPTTAQEAIIYDYFQKKNSLTTVLNENTILNSGTQLWT